jgi:hypothetical protein
LYELLTARRVFQAETALDILKRLLEEEPIPPSRLQPQVPTVLEVICLRCLRKEPAERYTDTAALADTLGDFLAHSTP